MKEVGFLYKARGGETGSSADRFALGDWDPDRHRAGLRHGDSALMCESPVLGMMCGPFEAWAWPKVSSCKRISPACEWIETGTQRASRKA